MPNFRYFTMPKWVQETQLMLGFMFFFGFLVSLCAHKSTLIETVTNLDWLTFLLATSIWLFSLIVFAQFSKCCLKTSKSSLPFSILFFIHINRIFEPYTNSRTLHAGTAADLVRHGVDKCAVAATLYLQNAHQITVACAFGGITIICIKGYSLEGLLGGICILGGIVWTLFVPVYFKFRPNKFVSLDEKYYFIALFWSLILTLTQALSFVAYTNALNIPGVSHQGPVFLMASFSLSWFLGNLFLKRILGFGLFEFCLAFLIIDLNNPVEFMLLMSGFRIVQTIAQSVLFIPTASVKKMFSRSPY